MGLDPQRFGPWRRELGAYLELLALTGVAVAQPAFDLLTKNAAIFVTLRTSRLQTVLLTLLIVVVPAAALWAVEVALGLVLPKLRRYVHAALAAAIGAVVAIEVLKQQTGMNPRVLVACAVPLGLGLGLLVLRFDVVRLWLRYLAIAPAIFAVLFLFASPVTTVVFKDGDVSAAKVEVGQPDRVVMIVMDEFPTESLLDGSGQIDAALFPNFAAFARESTWYRNSTTVAAYTPQAVPAILTGNYPTAAQRLPAVTEYPRNLFTLLGDTYDMNVHESQTHLCPGNLCDESLTAKVGGMDDLLYNAFTLWRHFASPQRGSATIAANAATSSGVPNALQIGRSFVRSLTPTDEPRLDFLHILLPHWPWHYLEGGESYGIPELEGTWENRWVTDSTAELGRQRHLLQVQATDRLIGEVVAKLRKIGAYDRSLVIFSADHGVAFTGKSPLRGADLQNYSQVMWTPLFIKAPGEAGGVPEDRSVRSIDLLPTIADRLDTKLPWKVNGQSILRGPPPEGPLRLYFGWRRNNIEAPPNKKYQTFDGPSGFATAMQASASETSDGDARLWLYQIGAYGPLIGRSADELARDGTSSLTATLESPGTYQRVKPRARLTPWTYISGEVSCGATQLPLAVAVNGRIAGLTETYQQLFSAPPRCQFWADLAPSFFRPGRNDVAVYLISGTPEAPALERVPLGARGGT